MLSSVWGTFSVVSGGPERSLGTSRERASSLTSSSSPLARRKERAEVEEEEDEEKENGD